MNCNEMNAKMPDLLFGVEELSAEGINPAQGTGDEVRVHLAECSVCREQLRELRATMAAMDVWVAPEPNPYFLTRLNARLDEERNAAPASWYEKLRARFVYGSRMTLRPVAAMAMTVVLLVGGGAYLGFSSLETPTALPQQAAVVHDLQTLDNNQQLLDQLETLSTQSDD